MFFMIFSWPVSLKSVSAEMTRDGMRIGNAVKMIGK